jgi:hypothetical protein
MRSQFMGRLSNLVIAAVAALLIAIGIAAQTGTVSLPRSSSAHGAVLGTHSSNIPASPSVPEASPSPSATVRPAAPAPAPPAPPISKKGNHQRGGGGDGGDGGD